MAAQDAFLPRKRAILVGSEEIRVGDRGTGVVHDVFRIQHTLLQVYGMRPWNITTMIDHDDFILPTATNVLQRIHREFEISIPGDELLLYLACHGGRRATPPIFSNTRHIEAVSLSYDTILDGKLFLFDFFLLN
jgi:hypothetical protein